MLLVDAVYINNGGGKVLLDYLILQIELKKIPTFYLLDSRVKDNHPNITNNKFEYLHSDLLKRTKFYFKNRNKFSTVLCFGNIPPYIKLSANVYTYFHQKLFLEIPSTVNILNRIKLDLKTFILKYLIKNSNFWVVQNRIISDKLSVKYGIDTRDILILPFYPPLEADGKVHKRTKNSFIYVSASAPHKNHENLIQAFCNYWDKFKKGKLTVTVGLEFSELTKLINLKITQGYPIYNLGFINRKDLYKAYQTHEYLIFPSLAESFGLGLVEAIEMGCKVISSNLPYTYEICEPSLTFEPLDVSSIENALFEAGSSSVKPTVQKISNQIDNFLELLENEDKK